MNTKELIIKRMKDSNYKAFTSSDFTDIASYKTISKCLEKLEDEQIIKRAKRGIYYLPVYNNLLGIEEALDMNEIAKAIARQYNWNIVPSGNYALNLIGLSTQVPMKYIFISNGPYNNYTIGKNVLYFKHSTSKEISSLSYRNLIAIQVLKELGKEQIGIKEEKAIKKYLSDSDIEELLSNNIKITSWIYDKLLKIIRS